MASTKVSKNSYPRIENDQYVVAPVREEEEEKSKKEKNKENPDNLKQELEMDEHKMPKEELNERFGFDRNTKLAPVKSSEAKKNTYENRHFSEEIEAAVSADSAGMNTLHSSEDIHAVRVKKETDYSTRTDSVRIRPNSETDSRHRVQWETEKDELREKSYKRQSEPQRKEQMKDHQRRVYSHTTDQRRKKPQPRTHLDRKPAITMIECKKRAKWFDFIPSTSQCLKYFKYQTTWLYARAHCQRRGGDLVKLETNPKYTTLKLWLNHKGHVTSLMEAAFAPGTWLGLAATNRRWLWVDLTPCTWHTLGRPRNGKCVFMKQGPMHASNPTNCQEKKSFICELS